jgi:hypothetical protein
VAPIVLKGVSPYPEKGSKRTRYQSSQFRVTAFTHQSGKTFELATTKERSRSGRQSSDVVSMHTFKSLGTAVGTYDLHVVPREGYWFGAGQNVRSTDPMHPSLYPGDWCLLETDNNDGQGWRKLLYGPISTIRRSRQVTPQGATKALLQIRGTDFGKMLLSTQLIYDEKLAADPAFSGLGFAKVVMAGLTNASGSPGKIVKAIMRAFGDSRIEQCYDPAARRPFTAGLNLDYVNEQLEGSTIYQASQLTGSLWQLLQQWSNPCLNELFVDYRAPFAKQEDFANVSPALVLREHPFSGDNWKNLTTVEVDRDEVISDDLGISDDDVRNWLRATDEPSLTGIAGGMVVYLQNVGILNPDSIKKFGFRRWEPPTNYVLNLQKDGKVQPIHVLELHTGKFALWHHSNEYLMNGTITMYHRPDIRVGYKLALLDREISERLEFYVEAVEHSLSYPGICTTTVTVTRGRDTRSLRFDQVLSAMQAGLGLTKLEGVGTTLERASKLLGS